MMDYKVLDEPESADARDWQLVLGLDDLSEEGENVQYGSKLRNIQESNMEKCSLSSEFKNFLKDHPSYISYAPIEGSLCNVLASIEGPPGTPYEKGVFFIRIDCPDDYPVRPPVCDFITKIYHPNISQGKICINILERAWCAALTLETLLLSICSILSDPFFNDPLDRQIAEEWRTDKKIFESNARLWTKKYASRKKSNLAELEHAGE